MDVRCAILSAFFFFSRLIEMLAHAHRSAPAGAREMH